MHCQQIMSIKNNETRRYSLTSVGLFVCRSLVCIYNFKHHQSPSTAERVHVLPKQTDLCKTEMILCPGSINLRAVDPTPMCERCRQSTRRAANAARSTRISQTEIVGRSATHPLPPSERYGLTSQCLQRAGVRHLSHIGRNTVAYLEGPSRLRPPLGRRTDAVITVLLISENGSALWRRHRQLTYKQVRLQ